MTGVIYKITNKINNKVYIGKTELSIDQRWSQHMRDADKKDYPLYRAIRKYGKENFSIEEIERCDSEILSQRECYWIQYYNSFLKGYNATLGGEGKLLYDHNLILSLLKKGKSRVDVSQEVGCSISVISYIAKINGIELPTNPQSALEKRQKQRGTEIHMLDKTTGVFIKSFISTHEAGKWLLEQKKISSLTSGVRSHIAEVCNGKRKSAYGYKWEKHNIT